MSLHLPRQRRRPLPVAARVAVALERNAELDDAVDQVRRATGPLGRSPVGPLLRGEWLGHALHPLLTDLPLGMWTATTVLDLVGGVESRPAARRLLGLGLLAAAPTAITGWSEWDRAARPAQRVGVVHAVLNVSAVALYAGSWRARRQGRHGAGVALALGGAGVSGAAGYLGGHLVSARKVSSRHPELRESHADGAVGGVPDRASRDAAGADVLQVVTAQHARIATLLRRVHAVAPETRREALDDLLAYLAGHEAAEDELVHPLQVGTDGQGPGAQRSLEESGIAQQIQRLEQLSMGSPAFETQLGLLEHALDYHCQAEEREELPSLAAILTPERAARIVDALDALEAAAPTRRGTFADMQAVARAQLAGLAPATTG